MRVIFPDAFPPPLHCVTRDDDLPPTHPVVFQHQHEPLRVLGDVTGHHQHGASLEERPPQLRHRVHERERGLEDADSLRGAVRKHAPLPTQAVEEHAVGKADSCGEKITRAV